MFLNIEWLISFDKHFWCNSSDRKLPKVSVSKMEQFRDLLQDVHDGEHYKEEPCHLQVENVLA